MIRAFLFMSMVISCATVFSQSQDRFYNLTRRDGLATGSVTSIVQDRHGLIWIGTKLGLNRYDGIEFIHFSAANSALKSNDISALTIDEDGLLWIGTSGSGLYKLTPGGKEIEPVAQNCIGSRVHDLVRHPTSGVCVLSSQGVAHIYMGPDQTVECNSLGVGTKATAIQSIGNRIWISEENGDLHEVDANQSYVTYYLSQQVSELVIQKIYPLDAQRLFLGTRQNGLWVFNRTEESLTPFNIDAVDIRDIIKDRKDNFWIGTDGQGIFKVKDSTIINYSHQSSLGNSPVSNAIETSFEDREGNIWFGTAWDGISLLDRRMEHQKFIYSDFIGSDVSGVLSIYTEGNSTWLGTDGNGLAVQDAEYELQRINHSLPEEAYVHMINKIDETYWLGTFQTGLFKIENQRTEHYTTQNGMSHDDVRAIEKIDNNLFLIATWGGGLNIFNSTSKSFKKLAAGEGQPQDVVVLQRMNNYEILVGTFGQGLFKFDSRNLSVIQVFPHIQNVISLGLNKSGVWIGTWGEGLYRSSVQFLETKLIATDELAQNANIFSIIAQPGEEAVWIATNEQVLKVDGENTIEIPLLPQQYHINSAWVDEQGQFYFGGTEGVIAFQPEEIEVSEDKQIELLEVKVLNSPVVDLRNSISQDELRTFEHDQNMITFSYATPTYPSSRGEVFELKLNPVQDTWVNVGSQRTISYADLNPGEYTFMVKNASSDLVKSFQFKILNPWWKTWWAYGLASMIFFGLLYSFRTYSVNLERVKNQLEIEKIGREKDVEISDIKQRFFVNISHEIRTPLTLIIGEIEQLALKISGSKSVVQSLDNLRNNGNHLIQLVNELLDFRKLDQGGIRLKVAEGDFVKFCREIYLSFLNKAEVRNIDYQFHAELPAIVLWYDRDQLEKVFFNLLSNSFKNTPIGGKIDLTIKTESNRVLAIVNDTGRGIAKSELSEVFKRFYQKENEHGQTNNGFGIGLSIVQEIVNLHKGEIAVESEKNKGSSFRVDLKKGKEHFQEEEFLSEFVSSESLQGYVSSVEIEEERAAKGKSEVEIMIVEDNSEIRQFLAKTLSSYFQVRTSANGMEAWESIQQQLPDLIISDVMMPDMDGITLTRKLKSHATTSHIPVILLTARTSTVFKKEGYETGADDYITKPFNPTLLITRVRNLLKSREILVAQIRNELATQPNDLNLSTPDERFLKDLVKIVHDHLDNSELNAELIANEMGMSHSVVYKKVKALTGFNLVEFVRDYRLQQASEILKKYRFSVAEACYKVGFSDKKYFSQIFKKKFGSTPSEYAKQGEVETT